MNIIYQNIPTTNIGLVDEMFIFITLKITIASKYTTYTYIEQNM